MPKFNRFLPAILFVLLTQFAGLGSLSSREALAQGSGKFPEPKTHTLKTKDGVELSITYYASTAKKDAVPVVMLPDWKESRSAFDSLAKRLQQPGEEDEYESFAVVTVDLRGHGDSTKQKLPNGNERELDAAKLNKQDYAGMITGDMEAVRKFLVGENDAGQLNLNKLSLLGSGMGATIATNWAATDWSAPPLAVKKQGQDVKALLLISPQWRWKAIPMQDAIRHPGIREKVAIMMMYGKRNRSLTADVKRIFSAVDKYHPEPASPNDKPRDLLVLPADVDIQGTKLLDASGDAGANKIIEFLTQHVTEAGHDWMQRRIE